MAAGAFRVYQYYRYLQENGWNQYGIVKAELLAMPRRNVDENADYEELKTVRANYMSTREPVKPEESYRKLNKEPR